MPRCSMKKRQAVEAVPSSNAIFSFARVVKSQIVPDVSAKKSIVVALPAPSASCKRKAELLEEHTGTQISRGSVSFSSWRDNETHLSRAPLKRPRRAEPRLTLSSDTTSSSTQASSSTIKGRRVSETTASRAKIVHKPSQSTIISKSVHQQKTLQTKIDATYKKAKKAKAKADDCSLPQHVVELITLNKAFLKTVTTYIAHNGCSSPIEFSSIEPNISRTWRKRRLTLDDIRRCIAIQSHSQGDVASPFIVTVYGCINCIEVVAGMDGSSIDQQRLCKQFEDNIRTLYSEESLDQMTDIDVPLRNLSLSNLPLADIKTMGDRFDTNPLFVKGQKALGELKSDIEAKQQELQEKRQDANKLPLLNHDGTKMSLLDRIRHKQLAKANEPLPPSGPELQRRAALNRVADVAATISMLSLSNPMSLPRQAFTMMAIIDKLKDSLRVPLSTEEGMACVRLVANEIAPEWLRIVSIGGRENVVIQRHGQPIDRVINERVQRLLAM